MGTISAAQNGKTMFVINGVGDKLYWAYSLTDEATDGRAKVRSKNLEEAKARLRQEFQGWDLALHILEVQHPTVIFLSKSNQPYVVFQFYYLKSICWHLTTATEVLFRLSNSHL